MKSSQATILVLPGLGGGEEGIWHGRWNTGLKTARRIELEDWDRPTRDAYVGALVAEVRNAEMPVVLIAHGVGTLAAVHGAPHFPEGRVRGAFLATPPDLGDEGAGPGATFEGATSFAPVPREPLSFPSLVIASRSDPHAPFEVTEDLAAAWGGRLVDVGDSGSLDVDSGHGPWPEGLMTFGKFIAMLRPT